MDVYPETIARVKPHLGSLPSYIKSISHGEIEESRLTLDLFNSLLLGPGVIFSRLHLA